MILETVWSLDSWSCEPKWHLDSLGTNGWCNCQIHQWKRCEKAYYLIATGQFGKQRFLSFCTFHFLQFQNVAKRCPCSLANLREKARVADFLSTRPPKICSWGSCRFSRDHQSGETKFQKINREETEHDLHTHIFSALERISVNSWHADSVCWFSLKRYCSKLFESHPPRFNNPWRKYQGMQIL